VNPILHSTILGNGKPMLVLHGVFGMSDNWNTFGKTFSEYFEVHLIDLRNHGRSFHSNDFNYELMVDDVLQYILQFNFQYITLLGHSMGGKVAQFFALKYPQFVESLIVVDIAPKEYQVHHMELINSLKSVNFNIINSRKQVDEILSETINDESVRQFLLKNLYWKEPNQLAFRFNLLSIEKNINNLYKEVCFTEKVEIPTLFVKGDKSNYITNEDFEIIKANFSNVQIDIIKNAGHWVHAENPTDFNQSVLNFLHLSNNY
jgi:pimeloyl-ACP methyl ester carboxylesterase